LVELLVVVTVLPLVVGGLALGLLSVFSLQSSVSNRLGDTGDSQVVAASFESDVQSSVYLTTENGSNPQCGTSNQTQLMGLEWNPIATGGYKDIVSYAEVQVGTSWTLVRNYCSVSSSPNGYVAPTSSTTLSYNLEAPCTSTLTTNCQAPPSVIPGAGLILSPLPTAGYTLTQNVTRVEFPLVAPNSTESGGGYQYTLAAVPADSATVAASGGAPIAPASTSGCYFATPGTGTYASTLCLVDFSSLTGNNLLAAEQGCLEMSVSIGSTGSTLYFCIGITGSAAIAPKALPTWQNAFLGNACTGSTGGGCTNGTPFYTGIAGEPALYQTGAGSTTVNITKITVLNPQGLPATGWEAVGVDAESTDANESISFTADQPVTIIPNGETSDTPTDPVGNACNSGAGLTYSDPVPLSSPTTYYTATCAGATTSTVKTGTAMVYAVTPKTFSSTFIGSGLEAMSFGLMLS
jgi:hypothetical protein